MRTFCSFWIVSFISLHILCSDEIEQIRTHFLEPGLENLNVSDWKNPTYEDYLLIQTHNRQKLDSILNSPLSSRPFSKESSNIELHGWITYRMGRKLVANKEHMPIFKIIHFNKNPSKSDKCVICYASNNSSGDRIYSQGVEYIIKSLSAFNFDGHFIYQLGGWPSLKNDRLKLADVPYAFKPFMFEEVRDLGYTQILWIDAACVPVKSLDPIFEFLHKNGCCYFVYNDFMNGKSVKELGYAIKAMGLEPKENYADILSQVVGIDLSHKKGKQLLDRWIDAAEKKVPFLNPSGDQFPFAILVDALKLKKGKLPSKYYLEGKPGNFTDQKRKPEVIIFHQYDFLNPKALIPDNLFIEKNKY